MPSGLPEKRFGKAGKRRGRISDSFMKNKRNQGVITGQKLPIANL